MFNLYIDIYNILAYILVQDINLLLLIKCKLENSLQLLLLRNRYKLIPYIQVGIFYRDSDLSCPSSFSKARLFFRYGNRCWILQSTENQDSVFYANCK